MKLAIPDEPTKLIYEGGLHPASATGATRDSDEAKALEELTGGGQELARVSVGEPETWKLEDVYDRDKMPSALAAKLEDWNFYLARFVCSFRSMRDDVEVEWARFVVRLRPDELANHAVAYDLYPRSIVNEVKRGVKVTLEPSLKFNEVEGSLGSAGFSMEYKELQPVISAAGAGESVADWSFESAKGLRLVGYRWMHMLIRAPRSMDHCRAALELTADLRARGRWLIPAVLFGVKKEEPPTIVANLW